MVGNSSSPDKIQSVIATNNINNNKKRKSHDEIPEMPFPKHVCSDQSPTNSNSSSQDSNGSIMSTLHEPETSHNSVEPSTSSDLSSSESRSFSNAEMETESTSLSQQPRCSYNQCAHLDNCICTECNDAKLENELSALLGTNDTDSKNFVLSSGRWSVNRDGRSREGGEKLTIDKEFESYFSMLML